MQINLHSTGNPSPLRLDRWELDRTKHLVTILLWVLGDGQEAEYHLIPALESTEQ